MKNKFQNFQKIFNSRDHQFLHWMTENGLKMTEVAISKKCVSPLNTWSPSLGGAVYF